MNEYIVICAILVILGIIGVLDRIVNHQNYKTSTNQITNSSLKINGIGAALKREEGGYERVSEVAENGGGKG